MTSDAATVGAAGKALDLTQALGLALARLVWIADPDRPESGVPVGAGVLVGDGRLITCAHVVNAALARPEAEPEPPTEPVWVDFPFAGSGRPIQAQVQRWSPPMVDGQGDIALLELTQASPQNARAVPLVRAGSLASHPFRAIGFPDGYPSGIIASGRIQGQVVGGWMQLEGVRVTGARVERGFSGTPVWDDRLRAVVGLVAAESRLAADKVAFMAPASVLEEVVNEPSVQPAPSSSPGSRTIGVALAMNERVDVRLDAGPWTLRHPEATPFTIRTDVGATVVSLREPGGTPENLVLTAETPDGRHELTIAAEVTGQEGLGSTWPERLSVEAVRSRLEAWAGERRTVRSDLFAGELSVRDGSALRIRVEHLLVRCEEARVSGAPSADVPVHAGPVQTAPVPITGIEEQVWIATKANSVTEVVCHECDDGGRVYCARCRGTGRVPCEPSVQCRRCGGSGVVASAYGYSEPCDACRQQGSFVCSRCAGRGSRACDDCFEGRAVCSTCNGVGRVQSYVQQTVSHEIELSTIDVPALPPKGKGYLRPFLVGGDDLENVPAAIRDEVRRALDAELAAWHEGEVVRRVRFDVVAATVARYSVGDEERAAYLLGPDREVHVPRSRLESAKSTVRRALSGIRKARQHSDQIRESWTVTDLSTGRLKDLQKGGD